MLREGDLNETLKKKLKMKMHHWRQVLRRHLTEINVKSGQFNNIAFNL